MRPCTGPMGAGDGPTCWNRWKFNPSKRIKPLSVPIQRYPSPLCAMEVIVPPGNPRSLPQVSWIYSEATVPRFLAHAPWRKPPRARESSGRANRCVIEKRLWEEGEFLNDNLRLLLERTLFAGDDVQIYVDDGVSHRGHSGSEIVLEDYRSAGLIGRAADGLEPGKAGLPPQDVGEGADGRGETREIAGDIKRLDTKLCVALVGGVSPTADFDVHFAIVGIAVVVPGNHAEDGGWLEMRSVANGEDVAAVAQATRGAQFGTDPFAVRLGDAEMECAGGVDEGVVSGIGVVHPAAIAGDGAHLPIVAAEAERFPGGREESFPFDAGNGKNTRTDGGRKVHSSGRLVIRRNQERRIFKSEMGGKRPGGIRLDLREGLVGPGLNPPWPAFGIDHDSLTGEGPGHTSGQGGNAFPPAFGGGRNHCEGDSRRGDGIAGMAATNGKGAETNCEPQANCDCARDHRGKRGHGTRGTSR